MFLLIDVIMDIIEADGARICTQRARVYLIMNAMLFVTEIGMYPLTAEIARAVDSLSIVLVVVGIVSSKITVKERDECHLTQDSTSSTRRAS